MARGKSVQHTKLHHCSYIGLLNLQHILWGKLQVKLEFCHVGGIDPKTAMIDIDRHWDQCHNFDHALIRIEQ